MHSVVQPMMIVRQLQQWWRCGGGGSDGVAAAAAMKVDALSVTKLSFLWPVSLLLSTPPPPPPPPLVFKTALLSIPAAAAVPGKLSIPPPPLLLPPDVQCRRDVLPPSTASATTIPEEFLWTLPPLLSPHLAFNAGGMLPPRLNRRRARPVITAVLRRTPGNPLLPPASLSPPRG